VPFDLNVHVPVSLPRHLHLNLSLFFVTVVLVSRFKMMRMPFWYVKIQLVFPYWCFRHYWSGTRVHVQRKATELWTHLPQSLCCGLQRETFGVLDTLFWWLPTRVQQQNYHLQQTVCTAPNLDSGYSLSLQPSQAHIPRPPTRCHLQCCPFQTACPYPLLWDRNMEPQVLP